jgi:hypothetical protein
VSVHVQGGSSGSTTVTDPNDKTPPNITGLSYEPNTFKYDDEKMTITCTAEDPGGQIVSYTFSAVDHLLQPTGSFAEVKLSDGGKTAVVVWTPPIIPTTEDCTISVYCTDGGGNRSGRKFFAITVFCDCMRPEVAGGK